MRWCGRMRAGSGDGPALPFSAEAAEGRAEDFSEQGGAPARPLETPARFAEVNPAALAAVALSHLRLSFGSGRVFRHLQEGWTDLARVREGVSARARPRPDDPADARAAPAGPGPAPGRHDDDRLRGGREAARCRPAAPRPALGGPAARVRRAVPGGC